jgi:hypothetical protein
VGLHDPRAEERLETQRGLIELGRASAPEREVQAHVEEPLGPLRDAVLQLERVTQRGAPIRIATSPGLLHEPHRRGELGHPALEEGHDLGSRARTEVQRHI